MSCFVVSGRTIGGKINYRHYNKYLTAHMLWKKQRIKWGLSTMPKLYTVCKTGFTLLAVWEGIPAKLSHSVEITRQPPFSKIQIT